MSTYCITGCSRGLGLGYVQYLLSRPITEVALVYVTARNKSSELEAVVQGAPDRGIYVELDVTSEESIKQAVQTIRSDHRFKGLDVLINNAACCPYDDGQIETMNNLDETFKNNVLSVHNVTSAFLPLLREGTQKKIVNMSTTFGSMTLSSLTASAPTPAYKITKAALTMLTVQYAISLEKEGIIVVALSPGWVKTALGGGDFAHLTVNEAAAAVYDRVKGLSLVESGKHVCVKVPGWEEANGQPLYNGQVIPW